jgi:hypothetical protein
MTAIYGNFSLSGRFSLAFCGLEWCYIRIPQRCQLSIYRPTSSFIVLKTKTSATMATLDSQNDLEPVLNSPGRLPSLFERAAHLELLDAIVRMVDEVTAWGKEKGFEEGLVWNMYCSTAALRFLIWSQTDEAIDEITPPLDVSMV